MSRDTHLCQILSKTTFVLQFFLLFQSSFWIEWIPFSGRCNPIPVFPWAAPRVGGFRATPSMWAIWFAHTSPKHFQLGMFSLLILWRSYGTCGTCKSRRHRITNIQKEKRIRTLRPRKRNRVVILQLMVLFVPRDRIVMNENGRIPTPIESFWTPVKTFCCPRHQIKIIVKCKLKCSSWEWQATWPLTAFIKQHIAGR